MEMAESSPSLSSIVINDHASCEAAIGFLMFFTKDVFLLIIKYLQLLHSYCTSSTPQLAASLFFQQLLLQQIYANIIYME